MTRSTNYSELRKMSNPIPINTWQMRSQRKNDDTVQYDPGIIDHCAHSSFSPHSAFSVSPSPSQSYSQSYSPSPYKNQSNTQYTPQQQQVGQNIQFNHLLNDQNQFDVQSELESLFVNATLSDVTLASNITENSDENSNGSTTTKLTGDPCELNSDELCDIEMNLNFINSRSESDTKAKFDELKSKDEDDDMKKMNMFCAVSTSFPKLNEQKKSVNNVTCCDPVLTQIALDSNMFLNQTALASSNINNNNNRNFNSLKRPFLSTSVSTSNFNTANIQTVSRTSSITNATATPVNIFRFNPNSETTNSMYHNASGVGMAGQYSMSLPSNYSNNLMEFAVANLSDTQIANTAHQYDLDSCQMDESCITTSVPNRFSLIGNTTKQFENIEDNNNRADNNLIQHANNYTNLSSSLPAYTIDDYMNKRKPNVSATIYEQQNSTSGLYHNLKINQLNRNRNTQLNKLLLANNNLQSAGNKLMFNNILFNSDSNLTNTTTLSTSVQSIPSPLSSIQDDYESINNTKANLSLLGTSPQDEQEYDEQDSEDEDESINNEMLLDLMNKNRDTFFWQYNIQSKGPKTKKTLTLRNKDPHLHRDFFDPVYQLQTISSRGSSSNKLRKGDGNDVTPNSEKLYQLGFQIRDFIQKSYHMNNLNSNVDTITNERVNLKREKNKIASRACRLKKKAQHEANKLKLYGLNQEHKQLLETITLAKNLIKDRLKNPNGATSNKPLSETMEEICNKKLTAKVAGNTDNYVHMLMQSLEKEKTGYLNSYNSFNKKMGLLQSQNEVDDTMITSTFGTIKEHNFGDEDEDEDKFDDNNNKDIKNF